MGNNRLNVLEHTVCTGIIMSWFTTSPGRYTSIQRVQVRLSKKTLFIYIRLQDNNDLGRGKIVTRKLFEDWVDIIFLT